MKVCRKAEKIIRHGCLNVRYDKEVTIRASAMFWGALPSMDLNFEI